MNLRSSNLYTTFLDLWTFDFSHLWTFECLVWSPDFYESLNFWTFQSLNFPIFQSSNFQISELSKNLQIIVSQISFKCPLSNPKNLTISSSKLKKIPNSVIIEAQLSFSHYIRSNEGELPTWNSIIHDRRFRSVQSISHQPRVGADVCIWITRWSTRAFSTTPRRSKRTTGTWTTEQTR